MNKHFAKKAFFIFIICCCHLLVMAQQENLASRFFFPGLIGIGVPSGDEQTSMKSGFAINTALEYRPTYTNAFFYRLNFDNISNKYFDNTSLIPTNVKYGKLNTDFFMLGAGYRRKFKTISAYFLLQPGYNISTYNQVGAYQSTLAINTVSKGYFSEKAAIGIEYYIVPHFALIMEPAYYHIFPIHSAYILNPNYLSYNIGFTTTLF